MTDHTPALADAMPGRSLRARWVVCGTLRVETAMHLGGGGTDHVDMPVLRDPRSQAPLLPGTTLAGALRNGLFDRLFGYGDHEPGPKGGLDPVSALFGGTRSADNGTQSPLVVFDALGELPDEGIAVRDGVAISPKSGVAEEHKKYDYEVLPPGTTFAVRVDLLVPAKADEETLLRALATALDAVSCGETSIGAKRSRGLGRITARWGARRYDLASSEGWLAWAESDHEEPPDVDLHSPVSALNSALPDSFSKVGLLSDARRRVVVDLALRISDDILVRTPGTRSAGPDVCHLASADSPVLPGTSLAGVMRSHALRIAKVVRKGEADAEEWVARLFGPRFEGKYPGPGHRPQASRVRVAEAAINGSQPRRQIRVAIDRFTQAAMPTALFEEQTAVGGEMRLQLELRSPLEGELGLLLLVLKDLLDERLHVGGTSSVGRGRIKGTATVTFHDGAHAKQHANLTPGEAPKGANAAAIVAAIRAFHHTPRLPMGPAKRKD